MTEEYLVDKKYGHGGRRVAGEGKKIGRPLLEKDEKRIKMSFRFPRVLADRLKEEEDQTELLVNLLANYYGVEP